MPEIVVRDVVLARSKHLAPAARRRPAAGQDVLVLSVAVPNVVPATVWSCDNVEVLQLVAVVFVAGQRVLVQVEVVSRWAR